ncbi:MAG: hypothetical protein IJM04_04470 [Prevotella sp.]|nr:hypothetical protein [Prevotella sp.]
MVRKTTIRALEAALDNGLDNSQLDFFVEDKGLSFEDYISATGSSGIHKPSGDIPAGLFIFGEENFVGKPDTVFQTAHVGSVAFYQLMEDDV